MTIPQRVAEEHRDCLTSLPRSSDLRHGCRIRAWNTSLTRLTRPTRGNFHEAHDLIIKSWTTDGPFSWEGKHYRFRYINVWPRTYQKPHPPIWIPGSGSPKQWVAEKTDYMVPPTLAPFELRRQAAEYFSACCEKAGYTVRHSQIGSASG